MALLRIHLSGAAHRLHSDAATDVVEQTGILGVDIAPRTVGDTNYTVVQVLLDDQRPDGDDSILSCPLVAEIVNGSGGGESVIVASALFDHDEFRRKLKSETDSGESITRGVLILDGGELPERWSRFAFVPFPLRLSAGMDLVVHRATVEELNEAVEAAFAEGRVSESERLNLLTSIEQHYPAPV